MSVLPIRSGYGGCRCACHSSRLTVKHMMPCCHPSDKEQVYRYNIGGIPIEEHSIPLEIEDDEQSNT